MKNTKIYSQLPKWSLSAFALDILLFFLMHWLGKAWCGGGSACYHLTNDGDRFANYLALIVAVMAILIPVSIELWRKQFAARNLAPKSPLDKAWSEEDRMRYLTEPVASMAIFFGITALLPLFVSSSALFYAAIFYGVFLLSYVFAVSFFKSPPDIYELPVLNPGNNNLPPREIMNELAAITLEKSSDSTSSTTTGSEITWEVQLSENKTLEKLIYWIRATLTRHLKGDVNKLYLWPVFLNFISKCSVDTLWLPAYGEHGVIRTLFADIKFYQYGNLIQAAQILRTLTSRFIDEDTYYETIGTVFSSIPTRDILEKDLIRLFNSTFRILFLKSEKNDLALKDNFPQEWVVTLDNAETKLPKVTASIYIQWMWSLQTQANDIPAEAAKETTETLFPEVDTILFAKFLILRLNLPTLDSNDVQRSAVRFDEVVSKWHNFGVIGRTTVFDTNGDEGSTAERYRKIQIVSQANTVKLVKKLGWFEWAKNDIHQYRQMLKDIIQATGWDDDYKQSWIKVIDAVERLFDDEQAANVT